MGRWINYDAIDYCHAKMHDKSSDFIDGVIYMAERIEEAPSIEIIRCRECICADFSGCGKSRCYCTEYGCYMDADSFHSCGKTERSE